MQVFDLIVFHLRFLLSSTRVISLSAIFSGPSTVLPRCALPKYLTEELQKHIPNAIFSSNPCRLMKTYIFVLVCLLWQLMRFDCSNSIIYL